MRNRKPEFRQLTADEAKQFADERAQQLLQVNASEAFKMVDAGKLKGTIAEAQLQSLRFLLKAK